MFGRGSFVAAVATLMIGCAVDSEPRRVPHALSLGNPEILGFETKDGWRSESAGVASSTTRVEGTASLAVPGGKVELASAPLTSLGNIADAARIRLQVPSTLGKAGPTGTMSLAINLPSAGLKWRQLSQIDLAGLQVGSFGTLSFNLPEDVRRALSGRYADLSIKVALDVPASSEPYLLDALALTPDDDNFGFEPGPVSRVLRIELPSKLTTNDVVLAATRELKIGEHVEISGSKTAAAAAVNTGHHDLKVSERTETKSLYSVGDVKLDDYVRVHGNVTTEDRIFRGRHVRITGAARQHRDLDVVTTVEWTVSFPGASGEPVLVERSAESTLTPGQYGAVKLEKRSTLKLRAGRYYFESLKLENDSELVLDQTAGAVAVYVKGNVKFFGGVRSADGAGPNFVLGVIGRGDVWIDGPFDGTLVAPFSEVELSGECRRALVGAFFGKKIRVHNGTKIRHRPTELPPNVPLIEGDTPSVPEEPIDGTGFDAQRYSQLADAIVLVQAQTIQSVRSTNGWGDKLVTSVAELTVEQSLKGDLTPGSQFTIPFFGGTVDGIEMRFWDHVSFRQDERAVLFLKRTATDTWTILGGLSGKWVVDGDVLGANNRPLADFVTEISGYVGGI